MVRITTVLSRIPVIKFRKGGPGVTPGAPSGNAAAASAAAPAAPGASPKGMSTSAIPDFDLPLRYRRQPLSQEEIDHINGGGIV